MVLKFSSREKHFDQLRDSFSVEKSIRVRIWKIMAEDDEAAQRKRKLAEIRVKSKASKSGDTTNEETESKKLKFRNYQPYDSTLFDAAQPSATEQKESMAKNEKDEKNIIQKELEQFKSEEINLVPKRPNHDLKSQIEGKLEKLKRRTQRAIVEILRERMSNEE